MAETRRPAALPQTKPPGRLARTDTTRCHEHGAYRPAVYKTVTIIGLNARTAPSGPGKHMTAAQPRQRVSRSVLFRRWGSQTFERVRASTSQTSRACRVLDSTETRNVLNDSCTAFGIR